MIDLAALNAGPDFSNIFRGGDKNSKQISKLNTSVYSAFDMHRSNLVIFFGCKPGAGVLLDTKMVSEIALIMESRFDRDNLSLHIPVIFDQLKSEDA